MIFYHVDRTNQLKSGMTIDLLQLTLENHEMNNTLLKLYPEGVSFHGRHYAIQSCKNSSLEQIYELIRLKDFANKFSRFQSFFAFKTLKDAKNFSQNIFPIYGIHLKHDKFSIHDMTLLKGETILQSYEYAQNYWSEKTSENPILEVLIKPPLEIGEQIFFS